MLYTKLSPLRPDFELIHDLMLEYELLTAPIAFEDYVDTTFAEGARDETSWWFGPGIDE